MTRNRQAQAAARSTPHGTWARVKFDGAGRDRLGLGAGARRASAPTGAARRWASRSSSSARSPPRDGSRRRRARTARSASVVGLRRALAPGPSASLLTATGYPPGASSTRSASRYAASGCGAGEQAGRGQHVVGVDDDPGAPRQLPAALDVGRRRCRRRTRSATPGAAVAQHAAGADQQVDLAQVLAGALDDPALGADHDPRTGRRAGAARARPRRAAMRLVVARAPRRCRAGTPGRRAGAAAAAAPASLEQPGRRPPRPW